METEKRKEKWIAQIFRKDLTERKLENTPVFYDLLLTSKLVDISYQLNNGQQSSPAMVCVCRNLVCSWHYPQPQDVLLSITPVSFVKTSLEKIMQIKQCWPNLLSYIIRKVCFVPYNDKYFFLFAILLS